MLLFIGMTHLLRLNSRRIFLLFCFACAVGTLAQIPLGRSLNLYTSNITLYVSYISVAVVVTWGAGLTAIWAIHTWLLRILRKPPGLGLHALCGLPILIILEATGSNILRMKLHDHRQYAALMPFLHAMHAPAWLYIYYIVVALLFFYLSKALGFYCGNWASNRFHSSKFPSTSNEKSLD